MISNSNYLVSCDWSKWWNYDGISGPGNYSYTKHNEFIYIQHNEDCTVYAISLTIRIII